MSMGVYIRGMEMPKACVVCPCACEFDGSCHITGYKPTFAEWYEDGVKDCPLTPVPPHGRLIDADAAAKRGWTISRTYSASPTEMVCEVKTMTDEVLPTIIEADVHDNNVDNIPAEEDET